MIDGNIAILSIIFIYFTFLVFLGLKGYKQTKTFSDYIIGGRKLGSWVGAMNVGASDMSSWVLMGLPGAFYLYGTNRIWIIIGLVLGSYSAWKIVAIRLRKYTEIANNSLTISAFLENRFEDKNGTLRIIAAVVTIFFFTFYIASGFVASATLFSSLFDVNYQLTLLISVFIIIFYAFVGGFLAVSWGDLFQGILILVTLLIVPAGIVYSVGGISNIYNAISETAPSFLNPLYDLTPISVISSLAWGLGYCGQPHIISKFMSIETTKDINKARKICMTWMTLSMIGAALVGLFGYVFFLHNPLVSHETVFLASSQIIFPAVITGVVLSAVLAAIMSTINGQIIISCGSLTEDFYRKFFNKKATDKNLILITRIFVIIIAFVGYLIATKESNTVLDIVSYAWSGLGAAIGPTIICALFWKKATKSGAIAGILSGGISSIIYSKIPFFHYELLPAFITSLIFVIVFSLLSQNQIPKNVEKQFEQIKNA